MTDWIKCSERMPESGKLLIYYFPHSKDVGTSILYASDWMDKESKYLPTHWMPLPEPPKEQA